MEVLRRREKPQSGLRDIVMRKRFTTRVKNERRDGTKAGLGVGDDQTSGDVEENHMFKEWASRNVDLNVYHLRYLSRLANPMSGNLAQTNPQCIFCPSITAQCVGSSGTLVDLYPLVAGRATIIRVRWHA